MPFGLVVAAARAGVRLSPRGRTSSRSRSSRSPSNRRSAARSPQRQPASTGFELDTQLATFYAGLYSGFIRTAGDYVLYGRALRTLLAAGRGPEVRIYLARTGRSLYRYPAYSQRALRATPLPQSRTFRGRHVAPSGTFRFRDRNRTAELIAGFRDLIAELSGGPGASDYEFDSIWRLAAWHLEGQARFAAPVDTGELRAETVAEYGAYSFRGFPFLLDAIVEKPSGLRSTFALHNVKEYAPFVAPEEWARLFRDVYAAAYRDAWTLYLNRAIQEIASVRAR